MDLVLCFLFHDFSLVFQVILVYIAILFLEILVCSSLKYSYGYEFGETYVRQLGNDTTERWLTEHWYLGNYVPKTTQQVFVDIFSFLVIFNNIVPISLYVTLEVQKFVGESSRFTRAIGFQKLCLLGKSKRMLISNSHFQARCFWSGTEICMTP